LQKAVTEGTGKLAQIKGYTVGGKTGTAQKVVNGRYEAKYISSFVGLAPVSKPRLVALVALDEPKGAYYGGVVAAPVFAKVVEFSLQKLGVTPDTTTTNLPR
jgi:cell division protein FtsI/penicillin-binding protein 2